MIHLPNSLFNNIIILINKNKTIRLKKGINMIDIKLLRENFEETCKKIRSRNKPYNQLDDFSNLDK